MDERRISGDRRKRKENRTHTRYFAKELTFVKLVSEHEVNMGQLLDISRGGLSIRCFAAEENLQDFADLSIFSSYGDCNSGKIPIRIISDIEWEKLSSGKQILRRYGIQFDKLTPGQTAELDNFLLNHTLGKA